MEDRVKELERALGRKTLEVEILKNRRNDPPSPEELARLAEEYRPKGFPVTALASLLDIPRNRFYTRSVKPNGSHRGASFPGRPNDSEVVTAICQLLDQQPRYQGYGYRRMGPVLKRKMGWTINHKRLRRLMREAGLAQDRIQRSHRQPTADRPGKPTRPNEVGQMDMTTFYLAGCGWIHVIAVIDVFDRQIVGHHVSLRARASEWAAAWDVAIMNRFPNGIRDQAPLVLQVDNGCQPTSRSFQKHIWAK